MKLSTTLAGLAALVTASAQADNVEAKSADRVNDGTKPPGMKLAEVLIRRSGDKVYISDNGTIYEELALIDTPEGARVKKLLNEMKLGPEPMAVPLGRVTVADGGAGVHVPKQAERAKDSKRRSAQTK